MKICVVGTGYVGLVSATCFADAGHDVAGVDTDASKVEMLSAGGVLIYEPELVENAFSFQGRDDTLGTIERRS